MFNLSRFAQGAGSGSPFANEEAAAAAALAAQEPVPEPPAAPAPSVWDRVSGIFGKAREDAKRRYLRLLRKAEVDRKELSDKEVVELAAAIKEAGIAENDVAGHRDIIRRHREAEKAAEKMIALAPKIKAMEAEVAKLDKQIEAMMKQRNERFQELVGLCGDRNIARTRGEGIENQRAELEKLFGD